MVNNLPRRASRAEAPQGEQVQAGRSSASMQALGAFLRERREAMGVSLAEVEVATRIRQKYLSALESDEWHLLPGEVVGRGFLRNYADYLGLEPQEVMERRRATTEPNMTQALSTTSAGAPLPHERAVDYRPKEVDLKDEGDGIQRGEIRLTPILAILGVALVTALGWWGLTALREPMGEMLADARVGVTALLERPEVEPTNTLLGVVNPGNVDGEEPEAPEAGGAENAEPTGAAGSTANSDATVTAEGVIPVGSGGEGSSDGGNDGEGGSGENAGGIGGAAGSEVGTDETGTNVNAGAGEEPNTAESSGGQESQDSGAILVPTDTPAGADPAAAPTATPAPPTPTPEPPTPTPEPPTPTPEPPTPPPAETPTPAPTEAPAVAAPSCPDGRSAINSPGQGQVISGVAGVSGTATHEAYDYYKLEYAPGANAADGFVYFDGSNAQVQGGLLGNFNTPSLPNGEYTIRLTVVDQSGNYPPPCTVSVVIQN